MVNDVLRVLADNDLYLKPQKCQFEATEVEYLGVVISEDRIAMDPVKVNGVKNWKQPTTLQELCAFLGFLNFYQMYICNFSMLAAPLMLRLCVLDYYFSPLFPLPCLVDCAPPPLSITCFTLALTVLYMRAPVSADVHPLCTVHARISSPLPYVSLHLPCTLPNPLTCVVPRPLYVLW